MAAESVSSPMPSTSASPVQRPDSPSPSVTPSLALDAVPLLDHRSVSTPASSTISTTSLRSRTSRLSDGGGATVVRRRGYMRPQGTAFADSARNRDSVMSLGSIAHMQYYFARTGLLDGKGAQLAKEKKPTILPGQDKENVQPSMRTSSDAFYLSSFSLYDGMSTSNYAVSDPGVVDHSLVESPTELSAPADLWADGPMMLPPTVSTYKMKPEYSEPLPDMPVLRRELKEALQDACKVIEESQQKEPSVGLIANGGENSDNDGFYEIQGLHILDIITLAIRAARNYYTAHANPQKLYSIRSEREIRSDLYQVLDILKRMASRNFKGGMRLLELTGIITWIEGIDKLLKREEILEQQEAAERESWIWREGDWSGREREREWLFLKSFDAHEPPLARWPERKDVPLSSSTPSAAAETASAPSSQEALFVPSEFLRALQDGQRLVKLHNALLARSKRKFHDIKTWHTDVGKPYRMAENLRYWVKAAELRWDLTLAVPVPDIVAGQDAAAWRSFDDAVFQWSQVVRAELTEEWRIEAQNLERKRPPELKVDVPEENQKAALMNGSIAAPLLDGNNDTSGDTKSRPASVVKSTTVVVESLPPIKDPLAVAVDETVPTTSTVEVKVDTPTVTPVESKADVAAALPLEIKAELSVEATAESKADMSAAVTPAESELDVVAVAPSETPLATTADTPSETITSAVAVPATFEHTAGDGSTPAPATTLATDTTTTAAAT